jgi:hypothetical protein
VATREELERRLQSLESRIQVVEDIAAIQKLKARYGELTDQRYAGGRVKDQAELESLAAQIAELFTPNALWDGGSALGICRGRSQIYERFLKPTLNFSWHYFVKPQIQVEGDRATGRWDILAPCTTRDDEPCWMAGVEDDAYARVDGEWLHSAMKLRVVFMAPYARGWAERKAPR